MKAIHTLLLASTLAVGTVVGLAPAAQAAPFPTPPTIGVPPHLIPVAPPVVPPLVPPPVVIPPVVSFPPISIPPATTPPTVPPRKPPVITLDPCIFTPRLCPPPVRDPSRPGGSTQPTDPGTPPPAADIPVRGRPSFTG